MSDRDVSLLIAAIGIAAWLVIRSIPHRWREHLVVSPDVLGSVALSQFFVMLPGTPDGIQQLLVAYNRAVVAGILAIYAVRGAAHWWMRRRRALDVR